MPYKNKNEKMNDIKGDFLQLARIALTGRLQDVQLVLHRASKKLKVTYPDLSDALIALLQEAPTRSTPLRKQIDAPLPVDIDSRLQLLRLEQKPLDYDPILPENIQSELRQLLSERKNTNLLFKLGLHPTKSLLFTGPPGAGKTMTAKWVAQNLGKPLVVLDLAAVMSSFLGRTGNNIRFVLDYAKKTDCILLLDELDAIAKRRDDNSEIGELKRLVTVLLQEIDDWPSSGLLIAATNHPDLLDPAVWRRFEVVLKFNNPSISQIEQLVCELLKDQLPNNIKIWAKILSHAFNGKSFSEIERKIMLSRKSSIINGQTLDFNLEMLLSDVTSNLNHDQKLELACILTENNIVSQRRANEITGISRDTIRKKIKHQ